MLRDTWKDLVDSTTGLDGDDASAEPINKIAHAVIEIEEEHPEWIREDSPTQHAGGKIIEGFEKVTHKIPMMSLSDVFSESELVAFDERIKKEGMFCHGDCSHHNILIEENNVFINFVCCFYCCFFYSGICCFYFAIQS